MRIIHFTPLILWLSLTGHCLAADLEWVRVADDNRWFVLERSGHQFVPWGFNYDHQEGSGRLIEDYWDEEWPTIEADFREMKQLGANVVRIHLQFGTFMETTDADFNMQGRYEFDCSLGIVGILNGQLLAARGRCEKKKGCTGSARVVVPDEKQGLRVVDQPKPAKDD